MMTYMEAEDVLGDIRNELQAVIDEEREDGCTPEDCNIMHVAQLGMAAVSRAEELERVMANLHGERTQGASN